MSETPNKRQRLTGSFSPASPPYHLAKTSDQTKNPIVHPNTPTSPPYMSSISHSNGAQSSIATAQASEMTPPSSVSMSQQGSHSAGSTNNAFPIPTPANSTSGTIGNRDSDGDALMTDDSNDYTARPMEDFSSSDVNEYRRSDHDRQGHGLQSGIGLQSASGASLYKLCETPHTISQPHASLNLIDLYGLNDVAKSVARKDPKTGEKINKLRKSYENQLKKLQLAGKPKAVQKQPGYILEKLYIPDEDYNNQFVHGKDVESGFGADLTGMLDQALSMAPGPLPRDEADKWKAYMNLDEGAKSKGTADVTGKKSLQPTPNARAPAVPSPAMKPARPERLGTKRRYNDNSFSGYGEGFVDDDSEAGTGEEDGRGGFTKKKRRKDYAASSPFGLHDRGGMQVSMVGGRR